MAANAKKTSARGEEKLDAELVFFGVVVAEGLLVPVELELVFVAEEPMDY